MQEPCSVPIFSHRKLLILAVPKLWKKCQQRRRGKNSHPAERNFFLSHIIHSQETLKYNTAIFTSVGVMQLLQHSPWGEPPVMSNPSPCLGVWAGSRKWSPSAGRCFPIQHSRAFPLPLLQTSPPFHTTSPGLALSC